MGRAARSATAEALEAMASRWGSWPARTRALAANAVKDQGRLLKVAEEYDRLAALAEGRTAPVPTGYQPSSTRAE